MEKSSIFAQIMSTNSLVSFDEVEPNSAPPEHGMSLVTYF